MAVSVSVDTGVSNFEKDMASTLCADDEDETRTWITELTAKDGNDICADCGEKCPEWASINLGVFLCIKCAGIHRRLSVNVSKVRSIRLDSWTRSMVHTMEKVGNVNAKKVYEAKVPPCWVPPKPSSRHVRLEQWIRAKYERKEFFSEEEETKEDATAQNKAYATGTKHGYLYKKMKKTDEWNRRWFVLSRDYVSYYKSYQDRNPKCCIPLTHLNITVDGPGLEQHTNSMLITFHDAKVKKTRNIFVYAENGKEIIDWFLAIRTAKISLLQETLPSKPIDQIKEMVTRDFIHTGYLYKTPPDQSRWQRRFFVLDWNSLRYYHKPTDALALGEIILTSSDNKVVFVDKIVPKKLEAHLYVFMVHNLQRAGGGFPLMAESAESMKMWISVLNEAINTTVDVCDSSIATCEYEDESEIYSTIDEILPTLK